MKKIYLVILFNCFLAHSQNEKTKQADFLFKKYDFENAAKIYQAISVNNLKKTDLYVLKQLADCYYYMADYSNAESWYKKKLDVQVDKESLYRYVQVLKSNGKDEESSLQMEKFIKEYPDDLRSKNYKTSIKQEKFQITKLSINGSNGEFGSCLFENDLYFTSSRNLSNKKFSWNNEPFLDVYKSNLSDNGFSEPVLVSEINSTYNDGPVTITQDGKTMYFSSESNRLNSFEKSSKDKLKYSKNMLFKATNNNGKWGDIVSLSINDVAYSTSNPCVSRDGKMLYFSSNRPGGYGGVDIWEVALDEKGFPLGQPKNLGDKINTEANESFPFINDNNTKLFYSSNGRDGFGAYDVYSIDLTQNGIVTNLGNIVNSKADDFAFFYNDSKKMGFVSSNRDGNDDLFMINPICKKEVNLIVRNEKTAQILPSTTITILDENKTVLQNLVTDSNGKINFETECTTSYEIIASKSGFENKSTPIFADNLENNSIEIGLQPMDLIITDTEIILNPIYFELNKWDITSKGANELDKLVKVMIQNPNMVIFAKSHTDNRDTEKKNLILSEKRAQSTVNYIISQGIESNRISGKGFGESEPIINCSKCTEEEHSQNRRSEFLIVKK